MGRYDLDADVPPLAKLDQVQELIPHDLGRADLAMEYGLIEDREQ